jgi:hypothetical protein
MADRDWSTWTRAAAVFGFVMALGALWMIARFGLLLTQAWSGHPRLVG